jgi:excisionase family DNA binding protein
MRALTTEQVVARYGIGRTTIWKYAKDGRLTPHKVGPRLVRYDADQLDALFGGPLDGTEDRPHRPGPPFILERTSA